MGTSLVSIITPTYNHEHYIGQCVDSVLTQSYPHWEMLILDDGSTDRTGEIVMRYADRRIRYLSQPHRGIQGLAETYNDALRMARGDLIAILEGDDFWPPDKLVALVPAFADRAVVLAYGLVQVVRSDGELTTETKPSAATLHSFAPSVFSNDPVGSAIPAMLVPEPGLFTYPCTVVFRRSALDSLGGFLTVGDRHAVDWATFINLALVGKFAFIPHVMGFLRRHQTSVNSSLRLEEFLREDYRYLRQFASQHQAVLRLSDSDLGKMEQSWRYFWSNLWRRHGRQLLLVGDWKKARTRFVNALLQTGTARGKIVSILGLIGSIAHLDIEWVWGLRRKPTFIDEPTLSAGIGNS